MHNLYLGPPQMNCGGLIVTPRRHPLSLAYNDSWGDKQQITDKWQMIDHNYSGRHLSKSMELKFHLDSRLSELSVKPAFTVPA